MIISLQIISINLYLCMCTCRGLTFCGVCVCGFKLMFAYVDGEFSLLFDCMGSKFVFLGGGVFLDILPS